MAVAESHLQIASVCAYVVPVHTYEIAEQAQAKAHTKAPRTKKTNSFPCACVVPVHALFFIIYMSVYNLSITRSLRYKLTDAVLKPQRAKDITYIFGAGWEN